MKIKIIKSNDSNAFLLFIVDWWKTHNKSFPSPGAQLNCLGNELLAILSILLTTNMPLQFLFLSLVHSLMTSFFLTKKLTYHKTQGVWDVHESQILYWCCGDQPEFLKAADTQTHACATFSTNCAKFWILNVKL